MRILLVSVFALLATSACTSTPDELVYGMFHPGGHWPTHGQVFDQPLELAQRDGVDICSDYASDYGPAGYRRRSGPHPGIDFCDRRGTPILAAADGTARDYTNEAGGLGVRICHHQPIVLDEYLPSDHPDYGKGMKTRVCTVYEHLDEQVVRRGEVERGDVIGRMGRSGTHSGPRVHLHFEVLRLTVQHANPHRFWAGGPGDLTCFDGDTIYPENELKLTLPVPC